MKKRILRGRNAAGNMSEFAVSLLVFFLFALFPLINLVMFGAQVATCALITRNAVSGAASAATYGDALAAMKTAETTELGTGFANFAKCTANGGAAGCGADLYVVSTALSGGTNQTYGPNTPVTGTPNPNNFIYEYQVKGTYLLKPFVNLSAVPFIGSVPIIGANTPFNYTSERAVENPSGLNVATVTPIP